MLRVRRLTEDEWVARDVDEPGLMQRESSCQLSRRLSLINLEPYLEAIVEPSVGHVGRLSPNGSPAFPMTLSSRSFAEGFPHVTRQVELARIGAVESHRVGRRGSPAVTRLARFVVNAIDGSRFLRHHRDPGMSTSQMLASTSHTNQDATPRDPGNARDAVDRETSGRLYRLTSPTSREPEVRT